ncbi:adenosine receptor A3-like [Acropora muricata]|uniref:adenosine receptor A3-like n=1 Tax=Acropora muricata TaxID=159855 RepID=UPI0034E3F6B8
MDFNKWNSFWTTCFGIMAFLIIVGNAITIAIFLKKQFRKRPQFVLISLAFADLLVGCATTLYVFVNYEFRLSALLFIFNFLDVFAGLSSIFHLTVISLERLHATLRPFRHRQLSLKAYWVAIATPWILSLSVGISIFILTWLSLIMQQKLLIIVIICLLFPLLITCFSYLLIWRQRRKSTVRGFRQNQELRFSRTIFLVTAASFITWLPFLFLNVVTTLYRIPLSGVFFIKLLQFSNSFVNVVIYIFRFPSYRKVFFFPQFHSILSCKTPVVTAMICSSQLQHSSQATPLPGALLH